MSTEELHSTIEEVKEVYKKIEEITIRRNDLDQQLQILNEEVHALILQLPEARNIFA